MRASLSSAKINSLLMAAAAATLICGAAVPALAVHPAYWKTNTEAQYAHGHFTNTVVNNYGELALGRQLNKVLRSGNFGFINAFAQGPGGKLFFSTAPAGKVYQLAGHHGQVYYAPPRNEDQILAMATGPHGHLLVGASGRHGRLLRLTKQNGKVHAKVLFSQPHVRYIWAILPAPDGNIYLATGPHGQVWQVSPAGHATMLLKTHSTNVLSLAMDHRGNLLAGTASEGMIIRINPKTKKAFVLLDAGAVEVSALTVNKAGDIFAATAAPNSAESGLQAFGPEMHHLGRPAAAGHALAKPGPKPMPRPGKPMPGQKPGKHPPKHKKIGWRARGHAVVNGDLLPQNLAKMLAAQIALAKKHHAAKKSPPAFIPPAGLGMPAMMPSLPSSPHGGNALWEISPSGKCRVILRDADVMLSMVQEHGNLFIGTGGHGRLLEYNPRTQTRTLVARLHNNNILSMIRANNGGIFLGTADSGQIYNLSPNSAARGVYTSKVLDAGHAAHWGVVNMLARIGAGQWATVQTRSGNVKNVHENKRFWSPWSAPLPANKYAQITSPPARFLQYRINLATHNANRAGAAHSPLVQNMKIVYETENLPPTVQSVAAHRVDGPPGAAAPQHTMNIQWAATDPNKDMLTYKLLYRTVGTHLWVTIKRKLTATSFAWNTRTVPDGKYRIKVIASDAADNTAATTKYAARVTAPFRICNTLPQISKLRAHARASRRVVVSGLAWTKSCAIVSVRFQIDSHKQWHLAQASNTIFDSPKEAFTAITPRLHRGTHRIGIRAVDSQGNVVYGAVMVTVH